MHMARKGGKRGPQGDGTLRKKTVIRNGVAYEYWEARVTVGYDPMTGRQKQRSFLGKTQKEALQKSRLPWQHLITTNTWNPPS